MLLPEPGSPTMRTRSAGRYLDIRFFQRRPAAEMKHRQLLQAEMAVRVVGNLDPAHVAVRQVERKETVAESDHAQQGGPPIGNPREVVDEPAQRLLDLVEGPHDHHQTAQRQAPAEVAGCRDRDGYDDREPAIAGGYPGEPGQSGRKSAHAGHDAIHGSIQGSPFVGFAAVEPDTLGALADANEGEAELGFATVAVGIQLDQRAANPPCEP